MLISALKFVSHAAAVNEIRHYLNGVFFEYRGPDKLRLVATDGHRLATVEYTAPHMVGDAEFIVASESIAEVLKMWAKEPGEITVMPTGRAEAQFTAGGKALAAKLVDGKFPDWRRVTPFGAADGKASQGVSGPYLWEGGKALATVSSGGRLRVEHRLVAGLGGVLLLPFGATVDERITDARVVIMGLRG